MTETLIHRPSTTSWVEDLDGLLTCVAVTRITHDVLSFSFQAPQGACLRFEPGQYLTFTFEVNGMPVERCYTIASPPTDPERLTITVKKVPGGVVSPWLHERLRVGDRVRASGPHGLFSTSSHPAGKYLFLSAGSGITPLMSMTRALRDRHDPAQVAFVHCARSPADIIFREELAELAAQGSAAVTILCEEDAPQETWHGPRGRLSLPALFTAAPDLLDREIFTCGPPPFMAAVNEILELLGADPARRHQESFVLGAGAPVEVPGSPPIGGCDQATQTFQVSFRRSGRVVECDGATPVLTAAARAGLTLPSSCGQGVCGTCKTTLLGGQVDMQHGGGIRQREIDQGQVLLCCSTPLADLELDA